VAVIDPQRWSEVDRVFAEALDLPPAERPVFLEAACAGDPDLRSEVERLLAADGDSANFLESSPGEILGQALDGRLDGESLGPYRLLRAIGSGGMGTVYLARREDEHYRQEVAIKILRPGRESSEALHRFLAERQILARLQHPNIARLYDGGRTADGRPYLVMEWIDGLPVDAYCDRHRLTVDQRLVLFQKICGAVQHAHRNLLVHRDLKPANILVTADGEPKLLDFGIAKRLAPEPGATLETQLGWRLLTPSYASPEQIRGEPITTASDVYSLGVLLYELLCGRRPIEVPEALPYEIERALCEQEPERPSAALFRPGPPGADEIALARRLRPAALAARLSGDLDNVALMALRKEPDRRYGSAEQLARDLEKHLQDLPVTARPDTLRYRTRKFLRRHRAGAAATAAVILLVAGFVASLVAQGRQLAQERDKARYALSFLVDTFKQADPYQTKGESLTAREILDQGAHRIARELGGQPDVQAAVMDAIGEVDLGLGRYDAAEPLLRRSLALRRQTFGSRSLEVAESLEHMAALQVERTRLDEAETLLREALAIRRQRQGGSHLAVARTLNLLGETLVSQGVTPKDAAEIEAYHREALAIARRVEGPEGLTGLDTLLALADLRRAQGDYAGAERLLREGLAIERKVLGEDDPRFWRDQSRLADILFNAGKFKESEAVFRHCLRVQRKLLGREHPDVATSLTGLAAALQLQTRYAEAEALNRELLELTRSQYGPMHWRVAEALCNLASSLVGQTRRNEAIPLYEAALDIRRRTLGANHWQVAQILLLLAELHRHSQDYPEALHLAHQAYEVFKAGEGPDHPYAAYALLEIGRSYLAQNRFKDAEPYVRRALDIRTRRLEPGHPETAKAQVALARCLKEQGRNDEAKDLLRKAIATYDAVYGPGHEMARIPTELLAEIERQRPAS
jgi:serine/threonine-protein kinase